MTGDMLHAVQIHANPHTVFDAVATQQGQRAFWTADATVQPTAGSIAEFGFPGAPARLKMLVEQLVPDKKITWSCQGDFPYWKGTRITWETTPATDGHTTLLFRHSGWPSDYPEMEFARVNFTWGGIIERLKAYCEGGQPQPYFPAAAGAVPG